MDRAALVVQGNKMEIQKKIEEKIIAVLKELSINAESVVLEHPDELSHGDYSTNVAMVHAKQQGMRPRDLAEKIVAKLTELKNFGELVDISKIEIAGPGFINFHMSPEFFHDSVKKIAEGKTGTSGLLSGKKIFFEYTQPNPFKEFHIGHMMNNMIGEAVSRTLEFAGAEVKRATYHGDVGLHVAKTIWGIRKLELKELTVKDLGRAYATGNTAYEDDSQAKEEIVEINKKVYEKSDKEINNLYEEGRKISFEEFERLYKLLGSHFDFHFLESEAGPVGKEIVLKNCAAGIFVQSEGAVVFKGEEYDKSLHTRVFINKEGLPTYEAKEIGLAELKDTAFPSDYMVTVTANEQDSFFRVVKKAIELLFPKYEKRIVHLSHGMLKLPSGKMSSRTGTVISAETLISEVEEKVKEKIKDRNFDDATAQDVVSKVSLGALRYSILRQAIGGDIIFDFEKSVSFDGDSGPYLQYACVRAQSIIEKARAENIGGELKTAPASVSNLEKILYRFPEIAERGALEYQPHHIVTYLIELAGEFNSYYAHNKIIGVGDPTSAYKVKLTAAFVCVMKEGLKLLGIEVPARM